MNGLIFLVLIIIFLNAVRASKVKNKVPPPKRSTERDESYYGYEESKPAKSKSQSYSQTKTQTQRRIKPTVIEPKSSDTQPVFESQKSTTPELTEIEKRRLKQQENSDRSRIHQNIHKKETEEEKADPKDMIHTVRDLIVCGYPTELKDQRDFIKEGEDFLAGLNNDAIFF